MSAGNSDSIMWGMVKVLGVTSLEEAYNMGWELVVYTSTKEAVRLSLEDAKELVRRVEESIKEITK